MLQNWTENPGLGCVVLSLPLHSLFILEKLLWLQQKADYGPKALNGACSSYVLVGEVSADSTDGWCFSIFSTAFKYKIVLEDGELSE